MQARAIANHNQRFSFAIANPEAPVPEVPVPETPVPEAPVPEVPVPEVPVPETRSTFGFDLPTFRPGLVRF